MRPCLHLITLGTRDLAAARAFYESLGYRAAKGTTAKVVFMMAGGVILALYDRSALATAAGVSADGTGFSGVMLARNAESEAEVEASLQRAVEAGGAIVKTAQATPWGGYAGYFSDRDGYVWEVTYNPAWPIDEDGVIRLPALTSERA
jgi:uncharacterized protein